MTALCPKIVSYLLIRPDDAPRGTPRYLAKFVDTGGELLTATFEGKTYLDAERAAEDFWEAEQRFLAKARRARGERAA